MQERIRIPDDKMAYYKDLAEMYVGDDVSPDFYGWVFPKYDHVAVGAPPLFVHIELSRDFCPLRKPEEYKLKKARCLYTARATHR